MSQMDLSYTDFYQKWSRYQSIANLTGILVAFNYGALFLVLLNVISFSIYILRIPKSIPTSPLYIGYANLITASRTTGVLLLLACYASLDSISIFVMFLILILLDGLDGYVARKLNISSEAGSNFDMETDALLVLALSWIHVDTGNLHWFILIPGAFKYINEIFIKPFDLKYSEFLNKRVRATIAVLFFIALILPFISEHFVIKWMTYFAGVLILLSFLSSYFFKPKTVHNS